MKIEEAKRIIREQPKGNVAERIEAIRIAVLMLGDDADEEMIREWAERSDGYGQEDAESVYRRMRADQGDRGRDPAP